MCLGFVERGEKASKKKDLDWKAKFEVKVILSVFHFVIKVI